MSLQHKLMLVLSLLQANLNLGRSRWLKRQKPAFNATPIWLPKIRRLVDYRWQIRLMIMKNPEDELNCFLHFLYFIRKKINKCSFIVFLSKVPSVPTSFGQEFSHRISKCPKMRKISWKCVYILAKQCRSLFNLTNFLTKKFVFLILWALRFSLSIFLV